MRRSTRLTAIVAAGLAGIAGTAAWAQEPVREQDCGNEANLVAPLPGVSSIQRAEAVRIALADADLTAALDDAARHEAVDSSSPGYVVSDRGIDGGQLGVNVNIVFTRATPVPPGRYRFRYSIAEPAGFCARDGMEDFRTQDAEHILSKPARRIVVEVNLRNRRVVVAETDVVPESMNPVGDPHPLEFDPATRLRPR